jgi:hypothetical protein
LRNLPADTPHFIVLFICLSITAGSLVLKPPTNENPYLMLGRLPLPEVCTFHNLTGLPCPGCGLTRSLVAAAHGRFKTSFAFHRLGILTLLFICLQIVYRTAVIFMPQKKRRLIRTGKILNKGFLILCLLFLINWVTLLIQILS